MKWNGVVANIVAHAAGALILSLVRGVFVGMRSACGLRWTLPRITSAAIAMQPVHRLQIRPIVHNYGGIPYHSSKLHPSPCNSVGMQPQADTQTDTDTDRHTYARHHNTFRVVYDSHEM